MRFFSAITILCLLATSPAIAQAPGDYDGTWNSDESGDSGKFHLSLKKTGDTWDSTSYFVYEGEQINGATKSTKVDGAKVEMVFQFEVSGMTLQSTITGEWSGNTLQGKYQSRTSDGGTVDAGTWKVNRAE